MTTDLRSILTPNEPVSRRTIGLVVCGWLAVWLSYWTLARPAIFPSPAEVLGALPALWNEDGLGVELLTSLRTNVEALAVSTAVGLPLAYLSRVPAVWPLAAGVAGLRFLSPAVFFLLLLFVAPSGHAVKVLMLAMGEAFFLVQAMVTVVQDVPLERLDDCRTMRMSEWRATWYGVIRSTLPHALDAVRDNAAMGWAMLTMVERIGGEGGIGVLMLNNEKHFGFAEVYAIAGVVVAVGLMQDYLLGAARQAAFPWAQ